MPADLLDCWLWTGARTKQGYGQWRRDGRTVYAHHYAYEYYIGEAIPPGMVRHHMCQTPRCVNPFHLAYVTRLEHKRRHRALLEVSLLR